MYNGETFFEFLGSRHRLGLPLHLDEKRKGSCLKCFWYAFFARLGWYDVYLCT